MWQAKINTFYSQKLSASLLLNICQTHAKCIPKSTSSFTVHYPQKSHNYYNAGPPKKPLASSWLKENSMYQIKTALILTFSNQLHQQKGELTVRHHYNASEPERKRVLLHRPVLPCLSFAHRKHAACTANLIWIVRHSVTIHANSESLAGNKKKHRVRNNWDDAVSDNGTKKRQPSLLAILLKKF